MNFLPRNSHASPLLRKIFILKFKDKINLENSLFISKSINNLIPSLFNNHLPSPFFPLIHTSTIPHGFLMINSKKYSYITNTYGKNSITVSSIESWNNSKNYLKTISLRLLTPNKIRVLLSNEYLKNN